MRRIAAEIESLGGTRFVLLIGLVAGAIGGLPSLFLGGATTVGFHLIPFLVIGIAAIAEWVGAVLLWWIAVRRRSALLVTAGQVTLGLIIADLLAAGLGMVSTSIETHGRFTALILDHSMDIVVSNLGIALMRSPLWFVGSLLAISLGRYLNVRSRQQPPSMTTAS